MIISREQRKIVADGNRIEQLVVSYVAKNGEIEYMTYTIPEEEQYEWNYAATQSQAFPGFTSWDRKPVKKVKMKKKLSTDRIYQILYDLNKDKAIDPIFEMNIPNTAFWDIETERDDDGYSEPSDARLPITIMSYVRYPYVYVLGYKELTAATVDDIQKRIDKHCENLKKKPKYIFRYIRYATESDMLVAFAHDFLAKTPAITGWNIFGYDWPYYSNRCKRLGIDLSCIAPTGQWFSRKTNNMEKVTNKDGQIEMRQTEILLPKHRLFYDYMEVVDKWDRSISPKESLQLDFIGREACGVRKVQHKMNLQEMYEKTFDDYVYYNAIDSILVEQIDWSLSTAKTMFNLAYLTQCEVIEQFGSVQPISIVQNRYQYEINCVFPTDAKTNKKREYEGAYVFKPTPGIFRWVLGLDFASLYPTTQRQFNISPDTFLFKANADYVPKPNEIKTASGAVFTKDYVGFLPRILTDFYAQRKAHKKKMMHAIDMVHELETLLDAVIAGGMVCEADYHLDDPSYFSLDADGLKAKISEWKSMSEAENDMQLAVKIFINSIYGACGCEYYKCYNPDVAEAITLQGQNLIKYSQHVIDQYVKELWHRDFNAHKKIAEMMTRVDPDFDPDKFMKLAQNPITLPLSSAANQYTLQIGGDTDSAYISFNPILESCEIPFRYGANFIMACNEAWIKPYLDFKFRKYAESYNCDTNLEEFELEKIARTVAYYAKKHYIMDIAWKEPDVYYEPLQKVIYAGIEVVQGGTPPWCRKKQKEFINWVLDFYNRGTRPEYSKIIDKIQEYKREFAVQDIDEIVKGLGCNNYEKFVWDDKGPQIIWGYSDKKDFFDEFGNPKSVPQQVQAAARYNNLLCNKAKKWMKKYPLIKSGDKVKIYYIDKETTFAYLPYRFPIEFAPAMDVDINFEKTMLNPINRLVETMGFKAVPSTLAYAESLW